MNNKALSHLNRYKFTLIYSVVFWLLGGFVLAVPFGLGGLLVDWLIKRNWGRNKLFVNTVYYVQMVLGVMVISTIFMANGMDPVVQGGKIADLFPQVWVDGFIEQMARYVPIIDSYKDASFSWESADKSYDRVFLLALAWYINFLALALFIGDARSFYMLLQQNNFYVKTPKQNIPKSIIQLLEMQNNEDGSVNLKKYKFAVFRMFILAPVILLLFNVFFLWLGFFGLEVDHTDQVSTSLHTTIFPFGSLFPVAGLFMTFLYGSVFRAHYLHFSRSDLNSK